MNLCSTFPSTSADTRATRSRSSRTSVSIRSPLVTKALWLQAELDILMLRPERPGGIVTSGGDLDNRLKTLFDGLRVPATAQELSANTRASSAADPIFTLLQDDALLTRVNLETDRLLNAEGPDAIRLIIRVRVIGSRVAYANQVIIG